MRNLYIYIIIIAIFSSCSSVEKIQGSTEDETYFLRGKAYYENGAYDLAKEYLNKVKKKFSYSTYSIDAEFLLAKCDYDTGNYINSEQEFLLFAELHPNSKYTSEAKYLRAMSIYKQMPGSLDRDLSLADKAIVAFSYIVGDNKYGLDALEKITEIKRLKAEHVLYVANFYKKRDNCVSAQERYKDLIKNYSFTDLVEEAKKGIKEMQECIQQKRSSTM